jgi:MoxR-like ATPase
VLLADEINRAPGKTQAALLEAMQERQVTIEGETRPLPSPFVVLATQNPIEQEGTYPLPEAQIDRFTARLRIGYPLPSEEREMLRRLTTSGETVQNVASVTSPDELLALQSSVDRVHVAEELVDYVLQLVGATRTHRRIALGCSPRAALQLLQAARAQALCQGRGYVLPDDLKSQARVVLPHRVVLSPDAELDGVQAEALLEELLGRIPWRAPAAAMGMPR